MDEKTLMDNGVYLFKNVADTLKYYSDVKPPKTYVEILSKYNIFTIDKLKAEYKLIQYKQSKLPRKIRDLICNVIKKHK